MTRKKAPPLALAAASQRGVRAAPDLSAPALPPQAILTARAGDEPMLLVSLRLPPPSALPGAARRDPASQGVLDAAAANAAPHPALSRAIRGFRRGCSDLTRRSRRNKNECNNICE